MNATTVESGGRLGVGTTAPLDYVHVQFSDTSGGFTGFAVQNLGNSGAPYSGMAPTFTTVSPSRKLSHTKFSDWPSRGRVSTL